MAKSINAGNVRAVLRAAVRELRKFAYASPTRRAKSESPARRPRLGLAVEPELADFRWDDFGRADELITAGEMAAREALPGLRDLLRERTAEGIRKAQERSFTLPTTSVQWPVNGRHAVLTGWRGDPRF